MAFVSSGYNPEKPMENRITDIGPRKYDEFYPPVIAKNKGKSPRSPARWFTWPSPATRSTPCAAAGRA
jgi:hypothetical protein